MPQANAIPFFSTDPNTQASYLELQRRQALAQELLKQGTTPIDTSNRQIGGVAYHISPFEGLAKMAQTYIGQQGLSDTDKQMGQLQADYLAKLLTQMGGDDSQPSASPSPSPATQALSQGAPQGSVGPTNANAARLAQVLQQSGGGTTAQDQSGGQAGQPSPATSAQSVSNGDMTPSPGPTMYSARPPRSTSLNPTGIPPQIAAQLYMLDPTKYLETVASQSGPTEFQKDLRLLPPDQRSAAIQSKFVPPVISRGSPLLVPDGNGGYKVDPGSIDAIRQAEDAKSPYEPPVMVPMSDGSQIQLSKPEYVDFQRTGQLPLRLVPPEARARIQADIDRRGAGGENGPFNVTWQLPNGGAAGGRMFPGGPTASGPNIGVSQSNFNQALDKTEADRVTELVKDVDAKGVAAIQKVAANNKMIELLPEITTGPMNKQFTLVRSAAKSLGVDLGDPSPNQEFDKYAIQGALGAAKQIYGSRITNQDVMTQIQSNPGATLAEKATYQLLKWDNELQQQHIQKMGALRDYRNGGGDLRQFEPWFAQNYPYHGLAIPGEGATQNFRVTTPQIVRQPRDSRPPLGSIFKGQ